MKLFIVFFGFVSFFAVASIAKQAPHEIHWSYDGENGPQHWGQKNKDFQSCKSGKAQSPVNIHDTQTMDEERIRFQYNSTGLHIVNNGHTIEIKYKAGSHLYRGGKKYELQQFHFHAPSEHAMNGTHYPLEVHLVHKSTDGHLAVAGVFIKEGAKNDFLEGIWSHLEEAKGKSAKFKEEINALFFIPSEQDHYFYAGSLTTPPCTENVDWIVFSKPLEVSHSQLAIFRKYYDHNSRPVQRELAPEASK